MESSNDRKSTTKSPDYLVFSIILNVVKITRPLRSYRKPLFSVKYQSRRYFLELLTEYCVSISSSESESASAPLYVDLSSSRVGTSLCSRWRYLCMACSGRDSERYLTIRNVL